MLIFDSFKFFLAAGTLEIVFIPLLFGLTQGAEKMPVIFIGHGSPMNAIEDNEFSRGWKVIAKAIPRPKAILCISAHWVSDGSYVTAVEDPKTIHDFSGFPDALYKVSYKAKGSPGLANEVSKLIKTIDVKLDR